MGDSEESEEHTITVSCFLCCRIVTTADLSSQT